MDLNSKFATRFFVSSANSVSHRRIGKAHSYFTFDDTEQTAA
ncbi:hypothetical protein RE6C_03909 [Rhodopirellula europaea 6C]|uniref:Uncharacterized protein n=1 Tax=Rhodopirellula europaea 6C TaxID=1263867 RepID=M2B0Q5_9BACT|nr:hypothetical protein RE6C_03909 [Rhodopirellula europaea 6C]